MKIDWQRVAMPAALIMLVLIGFSLTGSLLQAAGAQSVRVTKAERRVAALKGWAGSSEHVAAQSQVLSPFSIVEGSDRSWAAMEGIQESAQTTGLMVSEMRPSTSAGERIQSKLIQWDMKIEGDSQQMSNFFRKLPDRVPGIRMEQLQLNSRGEGRLQCYLRLSVEDGQ